MTSEPTLMPAAMALVLVLGVIVLAGWLLRRGGALAGGNPALLQVIATRAIGPRERVVMIEVGDQWLVLGVAPGSVRPLHAVPKGELPAPPKARETFNRLLTAARLRNGD